MLNNVKYVRTSNCSIHVSPSEEPRGWKGPPLCQCVGNYISRTNTLYELVK